MKISLVTEMQRAAVNDRPDCLATFDETLEQIELADRMGFHTAWVTEHHFLPTFALTAGGDLMLAAAAARTKRIRLGTGVVILPYHHPVHVAERMAALDLLSHGRLEFGTGRGGAYEQTGHGFDPRDTRAMWEESLAYITKVWESYPAGFSWEGKFWNTPARVVVPQPYENRMPSTWLACAQPGTFSVAADHGLGVLAFVPNPISTMKAEIESYRARVEAVRQTGKRVNNRWASFVFANCSPDGQASRQLASDALKVFFGPGRPYAAAANEIAENLVKKWGGVIPDDLKVHFSKPQGRPILEQTNNTSSGLGAIAANAARETDNRAIWERVDAETLANTGVTVAGDPDQCIAGLKLFEEAGVDEVMIIVQTEMIPHERSLETIRLFGEKVIPAFHG
jgi:alkanesulfonate monooxygenase SsuD/methylene tetrahydromethanopterin reductase-like flavin-dependent oxidoreductase (luciferase family)